MVSFYLAREVEAKMNPAPSPQEFFSKHAADYAASDSHAHGSDLERLLDLLNPRKDDFALDVATGTGFTAVALAMRLKQVIATDITKEMLSEAERLAEAKKVTNIRFEIAKADKLPYNDKTFDIVSTRRAAHHFDNIRGFLAESFRVLKRGGRLGIVDMSPTQDTKSFCNTIERLRDKTHLEALSPSDWKSSVEEAGFSINHLETIAERISFESWLYPIKMGGSEETLIRREWEKADSKIKSLLEVIEEERVASWLKTRIVLVAEK